MLAEGRNGHRFAPLAGREPAQGGDPCPRCKKAQVPGSRGDEDLSALKLAYEQAVQERDRIRDARAFFARQLGPLPAFAGISAAVVGAFSQKIEHRVWLWLALGVLALLILVSCLYSWLPAYRHLRAHYEDEWRKRLEKNFTVKDRPAGGDKLEVEDRLDPEDWYTAQIDLERTLYGDPRKTNRVLLPSWKLNGANLQDQLDRERTGLFAAQLLFLVVIGFLLAARL
jgi:hypothetical protein